MFFSTKVLIAVAHANKCKEWGKQSQGKTAKQKKMQNSQKQQNWQKMQNCAEAKQQICKTEKIQNYQNRGSISDKKPQTQAAAH